MWNSITAEGILSALIRRACIRSLVYLVVAPKLSGRGLRGNKPPLFSTRLLSPSVVIVSLRLRRKGHGVLWLLIPLIRVGWSQEAKKDLWTL